MSGFQDRTCARRAPVIAGIPAVGAKPREAGYGCPATGAKAEQSDSAAGMLCRIAPQPSRIIER